MQLNYELTKNRKDFKVVYPKNSNILKPYYQTLVYNLVYFFTNQTNFGLIVADTSTKTSIEVHIPQSPKLYISLTNDEATVHFFQKCFTFNHLYETNKIRLILKSVLFYSAEKEIIEDFTTHQVSFKVRPNDVNKYYELIIPLTTYEVLNPVPLNSITSATTLNDLHKLYETYFQNYQSEYDYTELPTILSIKELNANGMRFDSIHLKNNKPTYYEFNRKIADIDIRVSYNDVTASPLITILGLTSTSDFDVDLEIKEILKKVEEVMRKENIKLIKGKK